MEQQDRIMDGDLQTLGLQSILKMLALSGKTGTLSVYSGPETLTISLGKGQIVDLREDGIPQSDLLGMLCLIGKLKPQQAQGIRDMGRGNAQIALALLVDHRLMSAEELQQRLEFAVTQSISHALCWVDGRFAFHRRLISIESRMRPLDIDSVLLEALRQADEWEEMGQTQITRTTVARWLPEINDDVSKLGLSREYIEVLCLSNGELPLQSTALVLMMPEARVARIMVHLLDLHLIEIVDTAMEDEVQQDLSNIIIKCQHTLAQKRNASTPEQHLLGLITTLSECINGLLIHHGRYAKSLRGRGQVPVIEIVRYLERRFAQQLDRLAKQQCPILETATFANGQLDCKDILTLDKLVKGQQLEEFYWDAVQGLTAFLRMVFAEVLRDEVGNSHTGRRLNFVWKAFLTEIDLEIQHYQVYRAQRTTQNMRGRSQPAAPPETWRGTVAPQGGNVQNWPRVPNQQEEPLWSPETRRRSI